MLDDPILKDLPNLKMQAGTNYKLSRDQADRLDALWSRTGRDWSRDEALAGSVGLQPNLRASGIEVGPFAGSRRGAPDRESGLRCVYKGHELPFY